MPGNDTFQWHLKDDYAALEAGQRKNELLVQFSLILNRLRTELPSRHLAKNWTQISGKDIILQISLQTGGKQCAMNLEMGRDQRPSRTLTGSNRARLIHVETGKDSQ